LEEGHRGWGDKDIMVEVSPITNIVTFIIKKFDRIVISTGNAAATSGQNLLTGNSSAY
jgi:hypothetical protein